jgi:uncharacterized protein YwgA
MMTYDFVHLAIHAMGGEIRGKTKLQKIVYFLGKLTGNLDVLGYRAHYYGPYSPEVAGSVDRLRSLGFLDQNTASGGAMDQFGFEVARFDFRLNDAGKQMAEFKAQKNPDLWEKVARAAELIKSSAPEDYVKLSIAAKTIFMLGQEGKTISFEELAVLAGKFGWTVSPSQVEEAAKFLEQLQLVELRQL